MKPAIVVAAIAAALLASAPYARASSSDTTVFTGRFVCGTGESAVPLPYARVEIWGRDESSFWKDLSDTWDDFIGNGNSYGFSFAGATTTGPDGEWSFTKPRGSDTDYVITLHLDDGRVVVKDVQSGEPVYFQTAENRNDRPVQDYHTLSVGGACDLWLDFRDAMTEFNNLGIADLTNPVSTASPLEIVWGADNAYPWTYDTTVVWGQPAWFAEDERVAVRNVYMRLIEDSAFGLSKKWVLDEYRMFQPGRTPCTETNPVHALYEGFAEWYAGDYGPAPTGCDPRISRVNWSVEGMVAARLATMERLCPGDGRDAIIDAVVLDGHFIHSFDDLLARLPTCNLDLSRVVGATTSRNGGGVRTDLFARDLRAVAHSAQVQAEHIAARLFHAQQAARAAACLTVPCDRALIEKMAPALLGAELAQERLLAMTYSAQAAEPHPAVADVTAPAARLERLLGATGAAGATAALTAAAPLAGRDRSPAARALLAYVVQLRRDEQAAGKHAPRTLVALGGPLLTPSDTTADRRVRPIPASGRLSLADLADGTTLTGRAGIDFGGPQDLHFPGQSGERVCNGAPVIHAAAADAPNCPAAGQSGDFVTGTMVKFASPVRSVSLGVGAKTFDPSGHYFPVAAVLTAYDARGRSVGLQTTTVTGNPDGKPERTLRLSIGRTRGISYLELDLNSSHDSQIHVSFDELAWVGA